MADSKTAAAPPDHETGVADASRVQPEPAAKSEARPTADPPKEDEVSKRERPLTPWTASSSHPCILVPVSQGINSS